MGFYSDLDLILTESIEKNRKIEKKFLAILGPPRGTPAHPQISAQGGRIKNCLDESSSSVPMTMHAKSQVRSMLRLGCRGGGYEKVAAHFLNGSIL
jgi:hypothetical protein